MPPADQLRAHLVSTVPTRLQVVREVGRVAILMEDRPFVSEGSTIHEAMADLTLALREYAQDWHDRLHRAPNHRAQEPLVQLIGLSSDEQLCDWVGPLVARPASNS